MKEVYKNRTKTENFMISFDVDSDGTTAMVRLDDNYGKSANWVLLDESNAASMESADDSEPDEQENSQVSYD